MAKKIIDVTLIFETRHKKRKEEILDYISTLEKPKRFNIEYEISWTSRKLEFWKECYRVDYVPKSFQIGDYPFPMSIVKNQIDKDLFDIYDALALFG